MTDSIEWEVTWGARLGSDRVSRFDEQTATEYVAMADVAEWATTGKTFDRRPQ